MATPEPNPYRQLNYPVNNLEQNFDQTKKIQVRANIGIPTSVNKAGQVLTVGDSTGELEWATVSGGGDIPSSSSTDEGKVLTVDSNGDPSWEEPQGGDVTDVKVNNVSVVDNNGVANITVPTKTSDLTNDSNFITSSEIPAQVQSDWTEDASAEPSFIKHKPTTKPISAGNGISIVEYADNVRITNTVDPQVQANWAENNSENPDFVRNKPGVKQIVAGPNVTITEAQNQITISSTGAGGVPVQADWLQQDSSQPDYIKGKPSIPSAQVNADWTASGGVSEVLHKPATKPIVAGTGIVITETATEIIISLA